MTSNSILTLKMTSLRYTDMLLSTIPLNKPIDCLILSNGPVTRFLPYPFEVTFPRSCKTLVSLSSKKSDLNHTGYSTASTVRLLQSIVYWTDDEICRPCSKSACCARDVVETLLSLWNSVILSGTLCNKRAISQRDTEKTQRATEKNSMAGLFVHVSMTQSQRSEVRSKMVHWLTCPHRAVSS